LQQSNTMTDTAAKPPLKLPKTKSKDYWLKPLEQCLPITLSGVTIPGTNEINDGLLENYKLGTQPDNMREYEEDLISRGATCSGTVLQLLSPTAETGHTKLKPASSINKYSNASVFDTRIQFLDADGIDWAPKLTGDAKEKGAGKGYLRACLKDGATLFDMDIKCCVASVATAASSGRSCACARTASATTSARRTTRSMPGACV
jgi:hypothetical protein